MPKARSDPYDRNPSTYRASDHRGRVAGDLDDEDEKSFADLTSKGVAQVRGAWRREQDGRWRFWQNPNWSDED
jgi:hypothetical protein